AARRMYSTDRLLRRLALQIPQVSHLARLEGQLRNQALVRAAGAVPGIQADLQPGDHALHAEPAVLAGPLNVVNDPAVDVKLPLVEVTGAPAGPRQSVLVHEAPRKGRALLEADRHRHRLVAREDHGGPEVPAGVAEEEAPGVFRIDPRDAELGRR